MARTIGRLTAITVAKVKAKGLHADGGGLYLQVSETGSKSWLYRFMLQGRSRAMGLGPFHTISLAVAREKAAECRRLQLEGIDPIEARAGARSQAVADATNLLTFQTAAELYRKAHEASWRNPTHREQWRSTLATYVYPKFGGMPVREVGITHIMQVIEPIWATKTETANRLRGRIEKVLDWAKARGDRDGENPARWRGHLENLLPPRAKVRKVRHHPALPYRDIGPFMAELRAREGKAAQAMEFLILTATRTSETIGARWKEIDLDNATWTIPADRIKAGREHRIPLSKRAIAILKATQGDDPDIVFASDEPGEPLSNMALLALLKRMNRPVTTHGFRSTFRDWAAEETNHPREVAEMALAHTIGDKVEEAYRRGDLFKKRRHLMEDWANFCSSKPGKPRARRRSVGEQPAA